MKHQWCDMKYDQDLDRWVVVIQGREYGLHCGECFDLSLGEKSIPCRLELDRQSQWYVIVHKVRLNLRKQDVYQDVYKVEM